MIKNLSFIHTYKLILKILCKIILSIMFSLPLIDKSESRINDVINKMAQYTIQEHFTSDDLTAKNLERISKDLRLRHYTRSWTPEKLTSNNDLLFTGSEAMTALNIFRVDESEIDQYLLRVKCQRYRIAFNILNRLYQDRCARIISRAWDKYWYQPNEKGESKVAKVYSKLFIVN